MGRVLTISITSEQRAELEYLIKHSDSHVLRQRCHIILLKSHGRKTSDICEIVGIKSQNQVNIWVKLYKTNYSTRGINVLKNKEGQGRKSIFDSEKEAELIQSIVRKERQKLNNAKLIIEKELNKSFNIKTLKNFLKALVGDTNE